MNEMESVLYSYGVINKKYVKTRFKTRCPFHQDDTPSMVIDLNEQYFNCFGCGVSGGAFEFVKLAEQDKSDFQQLRLFKKMTRANVKKSIENKVEIETDLNQEEVIKSSKEFYDRCFDTDWTKKTNHYLFKRGYDPEFLNKCGVKIAPSYRYPIIIPLYDNLDFVGVIQRTVSGAEPKYMYQRGFKKSISLYGTYYDDYLIVTEGKLDEMKLKQSGFKNSVAIFGWKVSKIQIEKISSVAFNVISALDNDEKGKEGTKVLEEHFNVIRFPFPDGINDVGEMSKKQLREAKKKLKLLIRRDKKWEK